LKVVNIAVNTIDQITQQNAAMVLPAAGRHPLSHLKVVAAR